LFDQNNKEIKNSLGVDLLSNLLKNSLIEILNEMTIIQQFSPFQVSQPRFFETSFTETNPSRDLTFLKKSL
jgi:hypothetical protein